MTTDEAILTAAASITTAINMLSSEVEELTRRFNVHTRQGCYCCGDTKTELRYSHQSGFLICRACFEEKMAWLSEQDASTIHIKGGTKNWSDLRRHEPC